MKHKNNGTNHPANRDVIQAHILPFIADLKAAGYADFLRNEKGLAELSLTVYLPVVEDLLHYLEEEHGIRAVRWLDAAILRAFLFERAQDRSSEYVRLLATSLRSFLRFQGRG